MFIKPKSLQKVVARSKQFFDLIKDCDDDEQYSCGYEIDDHILDINIWDGDKLNGDGMWHCEAIECHSLNGQHTRGYKYQHLWSTFKYNKEN